MRLTLAAVPRRTHVLAAKAVVLAAIVGAVAVPSTLLSLWAGRSLLDDPPDLASGAVLRAAVGSVLYLTLIAVLSLGLATAVRSSATAIGAVLALLYVLPIVATAVQDGDLEKRMQQLAPMSAGLRARVAPGSRLIHRDLAVVVPEFVLVCDVLGGTTTARSQSRAPPAWIRDLTADGSELRASLPGMPVLLDHQHPLPNAMFVGPFVGVDVWTNPQYR